VLVHLVLGRYGAVDHHSHVVRVVLGEVLEVISLLRVLVLVLLLLLVVVVLLL